ncbi:MAG: peptidoglycan DD-metalloendopeptidase family protein [Longimicrobiales bacterium]
MAPAPGTVAVRPGVRVSAGTLLGRCGHTGHSSEPHLHFHVQDRRDFFTGSGLPVRFADLTVDGRRTDGAWVSLGSRVRPDR